MCNSRARAWPFYTMLVAGTLAADSRQSVSLASRDTRQEHVSARLRRIRRM